MLPWLLLTTALAEAGAPARIAVTYTTRFDLPAMADQVCAQTKICDCSVTYRGEGELVEEAGDRWTYKGSWKKTDGSCNDAFLMWTPADGVAWHTFRVADGGATFTEWIAHGKASATTRVTSNIKASGQVWLADLRASLDPETGAAMHFERETGDAGGIAISSEHRLTIVPTP